MNELENVLLDNEQNEEIEENSIQENSTEDNTISTYDLYYDSYYERVLSSLNDISTKESQIIVNQNTIMEQQQQQQGISNAHTYYFEVIIFLISLVFIISVIRNMLKKV